MRRGLALLLVFGSAPELVAADEPSKPPPPAEVQAKPGRLGGALECGTVGTDAGSVFHVSPEGRDAWSGRVAKPDANGTDGPLATIEAARDAVRASGRSGRIVIAGGDYYLRQPILFDARDAGLAIVAACRETPVLHGGPVIGGWVRGAGGRWTAELPPGEPVGALFVGGAAQTKARYPDAPPDGDPRKGWLFAAKPAWGTDPWQGNQQFRFHDGDLPEMEDISGLTVDIVGGFNPGSQWGTDTLPVVSIDPPTDTVHTKGTSYFFTGEGSRYFLSGLESFLDAPGEWWQDAASGRLAYMPADPSFDGSALDGEPAVAGVLPTLLHLDHADGMSIEGLELRDGSPEGTGKFGTDMRGGGVIRLEHSDGVRIAGNVIENVGVGIHVAESRDVLVEDNEIGEIAGNGIYLGTIYGSFGRSDGARILSNHIHDVGKVYFESAGVWFQAGDDIRVANNLIENTAQFGIAGGSLWGKQDSVYRAVIENNEVRNANRLTADGGAIKMMGMQEDLLDTVIRDNLVVGTRQLMNRADGSFWPTDYESSDEWPSPVSWAIYTDGKASGVRIEGNTLLGNVTGIGINGGWNNVVTGNLIAGGSGTAFRIDDGTGRDWHPAFAAPNRVEDNIVFLAPGDRLAAYVYAPGHGASYATFAGNRYFGALGDRSFRIWPEIMRTGQFGSLAGMQAAGEDDGSTAIPYAPGDPVEGRRRRFR